MTTLTNRLKLNCHNHEPNSSPAFYIPSSNHDASDVIINHHRYRTIRHDECWGIVDQHKLWLLEKINQVFMKATACNDTHKDVIIAYLSDNSPELLMNVLGCIDLTDEHFPPNTVAGVLPAMMNVRWTPLEIARVLIPKKGSGSPDGKTNNSISFVTILLYGYAYKNAADEAIQFISKSSTFEQHIAIALPIPKNITINNCELSTVSKLPAHSDPMNSDAILLFTSGTSSALGIPKGVRLSHQSLYIQAFAKTQSPCCYDKKTIIAANTVPLFHIGGLSSLLAVLLCGGTLLFPNSDDDSTNKGFRVEMVLRSMSTKTETTDCPAVNTLVVVPAMLHSIFEQIGRNKDKDRLTFPRVRLILVGGQSLGSGRLYAQTRQYFPNAKIVQTYACTEAGSSITFQDLGYSHSELKPSDELVIAGAAPVGFPPPHIRIRIFDENQTILPDGEMGIIATRGKHIMLGYWNRNNALSQQPEKVLHDWMLTTDLGYVHPNSGELYFCGRKNDVIRSGGESVLASEVESILLMNPDLSEVAVFSLPHEKFGEVVCAAVVTDEPRIETIENNSLKEKLRQHCTAHHLAGYKHPRRVFCMKSLPRNSSGKVLKQQIVMTCLQQLSMTSRL